MGGLKLQLAHGRATMLDQEQTVTPVMLALNSLSRFLGQQATPVLPKSCLRARCPWELMVRPLKSMPCLMALQDGEWAMASIMVKLTNTANATTTGVPSLSHKLTKIKLRT